MARLHIQLVTQEQAYHFCSYFGKLPSQRGARLIMRMHLSRDRGWAPSYEELLTKGNIILRYILV